MAMLNNQIHDMFMVNHHRFPIIVPSTWTQMFQADFPCRHSRSRPIAMPAFLAGFRLPPQGPALKALRLERLSSRGRPKDRGGGCTIWGCVKTL